MTPATTFTAAVVLAILAAACSESTVGNETGGQLALHAPATQTIAPGETCAVDVSIARTAINDAVSIRFDGLPSGIDVVEKDPAVPAGSDGATFTLHAANDARPVDDQVVTVTASAASGMSVSKQFALRVLPRD